MSGINIEPGRPEKSEYLEYYETYLSKVDGDEILPLLESQIGDFRAVFDAIPADQIDVLHAPYTWTIKQVVGHCVDTERVFGYRAGRFAAGDETPLPGFDQDLYVEQTDYSLVTLADLTGELEHLRRGNIAMLKRQNANSWMRKGLGDGKAMTVRAAAFIMVGHINHHLEIVKKRLG
ncbi:MAG: DinB family protein [Mariniblastus sp.]